MNHISSMHATMQGEWSTIFRVKIVAWRLSRLICQRLFTHFVVWRDKTHAKDGATVYPAKFIAWPLLILNRYCTCSCTMHYPPIHTCTCTACRVQGPNNQYVVIGCRYTHIHKNLPHPQYTVLSCSTHTLYTVGILHAILCGLAISCRVILKPCLCRENRRSVAQCLTNLGWAFCFFQLK